MHAQWKNEPMLYKHYYRNTFFAKTSRSCNGTAVGVKRNMPKGKTMIRKQTRTKQNQKKYMQQRK